MRYIGVFVPSVRSVLEKPRYFLLRVVNVVNSEQELPLACDVGGGWEAKFVLDVIPDGLFCLYEQTATPGR
jgi:hypothetical protein